MTAKTKTPETDALCSRIWNDNRGPLEAVSMMADCARTLELRNAELKAKLAEVEREIADVRAQAKEHESTATAYAYEQGADDARSGVQEVVTHPEEPGLLSSEDEMKSAFRIRYYCDSGDRKTGIYGWSSWVVAEDQTGTILADVVAARDRLTAQLAAAQADSRRVDWIENEAGRDWPFGSQFDVKFTCRAKEPFPKRPSIRAAIDAAMSTPPEA